MMKKLLFVCFILIHATVFGQITDDFSDGDFTNNPTWSGDLAFFVIQNDTLRSSGPDASGELYLSTPSTAINKATWEFLVKLDFAPSTSNQVKIYLVSDQQDLETDLNGYFIEIGQSSDDVIKFKRQNGGTSTTLFTGSSVFTGDVLVRIKVVRDDLGNWEVFSDPAGESNFSPEGASFFDDTFSTSSYFGLVCKHTATRKDDFYFDDFVITVEPDTQSPRIDTIQVISLNEVEVYFDETVDQSSAQMIGNYAIDGGIGSPATASLDMSDPSLVHLTLANSLTNGSSYELTTQNVEDLNGNGITVESKTFMVLIPEVAEVKDLVINEIMADHSPVVGLPASDYVEIYNRSDKYLDLANYTLSGATISVSPYIIAPHEYIILCQNSNVDLLQPFGKVIGISSWNALNQEDETVTIEDTENAQIIDELTYDKSWYHNAEKEDGGWSLELINPDHPCSDSDNWIASEAELGGTPGAENVVFDNKPDLTSPRLLSAIVLNEDSLLLTFDEKLEVASFESSVYTFEPSLFVDEKILQGNLKTIVLTFSAPLQTAITYTVYVSLLKDCSNNEIGNDQEAIFFLTSIPNSKEIVINEIMADPSPVKELPNVEYVELYNNSSQFFDLKDYLLNDENITSTNYVLPPNEYITLLPEESASLFSSFGKVIGMNSWDALTNAGEQIVLKSSDGTLIDEVTFDDSWYNSIDKNDGGWSLELIDTENKCGEENNWSASIDDAGGTPGSVNSIFGSKPDLTGPALLSAIAITQDSLILAFDERLDVNTFASVVYTFEPRLSIDHAVLNDNLREITIIFSGSLEPSLAYEVSISQLRDCNGNIIGDENTKTFILSEVAEQGDLLINEVLYNPITSGGDFVEIYNHSEKYIDLKNWAIANGSDLSPENIKTISENHLLMAPQQYMVLTEEVGAVAADYPKGVLENFEEVASLPSFPNEKQGIILLSPNGVIIDYFQYDNDIQHALLDDDKGVSLERISFDSPTNNRNNWHSAAKAVGFATPGYVNSQSHMVPNNTADNIVISPKVFLPNQSGQDDFTTINYSFNQAGFVANVSIVDVSGRVIRSIAQNELLASEGFFQWDGTMDNGRKARSGVFIVTFEVFDLSGNQQTHKKRVIIAPQL